MTFGTKPEGERPRVSACVVSFDEEENIRACLDSVAWCDEIVVVDSFSRDRTADFARERGAVVIQRPWPGNVAQKNHALEAATGDWVLFLDCDEEVTPRLRDCILSRLRERPSVAGYYLSRQLYYGGSWLEHGGWFPEWRLVLFRRERGRFEGVDPHGRVQLTGDTDRLDPGGAGSDAAVILHRSFRGLSHQLKVLDRYTSIQSGELYRQGRRSGWLDLTLRPAWRFLWTYLFRLGFMDGGAGYHMAVNHAYAAYMKYARLWEIQNGFAELGDKSQMVPGREEGRPAPPGGVRS